MWAAWLSVWPNKDLISRAQLHNGNLLPLGVKAPSPWPPKEAQTGHSREAAESPFTLPSLKLPAARILFSLEKEGNSDTGYKHMNLQDDMPREMNQSQKDKYRIISLV